VEIKVHGTQSGRKATCVLVVPFPSSNSLGSSLGLALSAEPMHSTLSIPTTPQLHHLPLSSPSLPHSHSVA
jgi:hypothetical protein